jgi:predicted anti-sigma-YlaC factor YlaD
MNCSQSQDLLQRRLDGEPIDDRAALDEHLAVCAECRSLHTAAGQLLDGLRLLPALAPPTMLGTNIVAAALEERRSRVLKQRLWMAGAALAAGLLIAVLMGFSGKSSSTTGLIVTEVVTPDPEPIEKMPREVPTAPSLRGSVAEAGSAVVSLTRRTADETREQTRLLTEALPMGTPLPGLEAVPPALDPPVQSVLQETSQRVSSGFEPVTSSARRAFSMFAREVTTAPLNQ